MSAESHCDVAVIGAGFAGLRTALRLRDAGLSVRVLEARDRVGGRSAAATLNGRTIDVGGQWVGVGHERLRALAGSCNASLVPQYTAGSKLLELGGRMRRYDGLIPPASVTALVEMQSALWRLRALQRRVPPDAPWDAHGADALDRLSVDAWQARWLRSRGARALFDIGVRAVFCGTPRQLSMLGFLHYLRANRDFDALLSTTDGAQAWTVDGGMHALAVRMGAALGDALQLDTPVRQIEQQADSVVVHTPRGALRASRVVVAMAPPAAGRIDYAVALPAREQLAQRMPMGSVIKVLVAYAKPFWRANGLSGEFVGDAAAFSPVFDASPADASHGALIGFFDGPEAVHWSGDAQARRREVIATLVRAFGPEAAEPLDYAEKDWIADPWSRGCYTGLWTPGTLTEVGSALRAPCGRVHWAGTETATEWCGYIEGALASGDRVADELRHAMAS